jgi:hypothetical protein
MVVLQLSVSKRRLNNSCSSSKSAKLHNRSINNNRRGSPGKLRLSNSCNLRIINKRNSNLSSRRSIDKSRRSPGKLRLSSSCNMRISIDETAASPAGGGGAQAISTAEGEPGQLNSV